MSWFTHLKGFEIGASCQEIRAVYGIRIIRPKSGDYDHPYLCGVTSWSFIKSTFKFDHPTSWLGPLPPLEPKCILAIFLAAQRRPMKINVRPPARIGRICMAGRPPCTVLSWKVKTRLRDPAPWIPLAAGASSRNLVITFQLSTVQEMAGRRTLYRQIFESGILKL